MMMRLAVRFFVTILIARWMYAETELLVPQALPLINATFETIKIPTHDKWNDERVREVRERVQSTWDEIDPRAALGTLKDSGVTLAGLHKTSDDAVRDTRAALESHFSRF